MQTTESINEKSFSLFTDLALAKWQAEGGMALGADLLDAFTQLVLVAAGVTDARVGMRAAVHHLQKSSICGVEAGAIFVKARELERANSDVQHRLMFARDLDAPEVALVMAEYTKIRAQAQALAADVAAKMLAMARVQSAGKINLQPPRATPNNPAMPPHAELEAAFVAASNKTTKKTTSKGESPAQHKPATTPIVEYTDLPLPFLDHDEAMAQLDIIDQRGKAENSEVARTRLFMQYNALSDALEGKTAQQIAQKMQIPTDRVIDLIVCGMKVKPPKLQ